MVSTTSPEIIHERLTCARLELNTFPPDQLSFLAPATPRTPTTPSEWFCRHFPDQVKLYGCPFIELREVGGEMDRLTPLAINHDFFAGILGGDKRLGHSVVYFDPEMQFYFLDCRDQLYKPTTQDKLQNLIRAFLIRSAQELPDTVHKLNLFHEFRSDKVVRQIIHRAKSILAADFTFFSVNSQHQRVKGEELHERLAKQFIESVIEKKDGQFLTLSTAYLIFCDLVKQKSLGLIERSKFREIVGPLVRETFDLGLRNDVVDKTTNKQTQGWKGLCLGGGKVNSYTTV